MSQPAVTLDSASVEAIAQRVNALVLNNLIEVGLDDLAERIGERILASDALSSRQRPHLVDAHELAARLNVSRDTIYQHAEELGGQRIGSGPRPRLRFDSDRALEVWTSRSPSKESEPPKTSVASGGSLRRGRERLDSRPDLLPIKGAPIARNSEGGQS